MGQSAEAFDDVSALLRGGALDSTRQLRGGFHRLGLEVLVAQSGARHSNGAVEQACVLRDFLLMHGR